MKNKALIVAVSEFTTLVQSKAFLIGLLMMPVFMGIAFGVQKFTRNATDVKDRAFVVVDRTGVLYAPLKAAADELEPRQRRAGGRPDRSRASCRRTATFDEGDDQARAALSDRVKRDELYAFVEIPEGRARPRVDRDDPLLLESPGLPAAAVVARDDRQPRDHESPVPRRRRSIARS